MQKIDISRIDGHTLRVFASICETHSVSRTAALFSVNQSTISHTLDKLRSAVGDPLFVKSGRGITPSEKALSILPRVQSILADIQGLVAPEVYEAGDDIRPYVVAIPGPAFLMEMKALYLKLAEVAPNARLELRRMAPRNRLLDVLAQDEAEVAIAISGKKYPAVLNHQRYGADELAVFYDPQCRASVDSIEDYAACRHAVVDFGGNEKSHVELALGQCGLARSVSMVAPTASMLGELIKGTDLVATMPRRLVHGAYRQLACCPVPFDLPDISYDLVWHRRYEHSGRNAWLRELVLSSRDQVEPSIAAVAPVN